MSERTFFRVERGLEIFKKRSDIFMLVAFSSGHFRASGRRGKNLKNRNVRRTLIVNDPSVAAQKLRIALGKPFFVSRNKWIVTDARVGVKNTFDEKYNRVQWNFKRGYAWIASG